MTVNHTTSAAARSSAFEDASVPQNYRKYLEPHIFAPWAERLLDVAGIEAGQTVLDVACGTGAVTLAAARRIGPSGKVVASDISPAMLAMIVNPGSNGAPIETIECRATKLRVQDRSFDRVLCQHGLPFIPDRIGAIHEMQRVVRDGGVVCVAVFARGFRCEPFETYLEALRDRGVPPPFPGAYDRDSFVMSEEDVQDIFEKVGFSEIYVNTEELEVSWPDATTVASGLAGTPFGAAAAKLGLLKEVSSEIAKRFSDKVPVSQMTKSVVARAVA